MVRPVAPEPKRRDWLFTATKVMAGVIVGAAVWPLIRATGPTADSQNRGLRVHVGDLRPGSQVSVLLEGTPIIIRRRTAEEIAAAQAVPLANLIDVDARNSNKPGADASDGNRTVPPFSAEDQGEWLVIVGVCTHLGCIPLGDGAGDFGGWFCPCHSAHFDASGRTRSAPAPTNMGVPLAEFIDEATLHIVSLGGFSRRTRP